MKSHLVRIAVACMIAGIVTAIYASGGLRLIDNAVHELHMRSVDIPASGELVIVEIDAQSLRRLGQWPWPRGHHARVLDRLVDAGAAHIAFDVSFSSPSDPAQDTLLAEAAQRAGDRLILPVFQQLQETAEGATIALIDRPLPQLFAGTALASINVRPDSDGIVRRLPPFDRIDGAVVPFMSTALLPVMPMQAPDSVVLDFGIDPYSVPRLSFADVLLGSFDPALVADRSVLVGATAIELGDVLAVPRWGNLPGPLVIATGFETQLQDRAARTLDAAWFVFALCFVAAVAPGYYGNQRALAILAPAVVQTAGLAALGHVLYAEWAAKLDLAPIGLALMAGYGLELVRMLSRQARRIAAQNREAERRQSLLLSVVATSIDAVVITDRRGMIRIANPACLTVFGREPQSLVGVPWSALIRPDDRIAGQLWALMEGDGEEMPLHFPVDVQGVHATDGSLELELALAQVAGLGVGDAPDDRHFIYVFRDVSAQRQLEASRRKALEAQLEAERAKADFLATASHELRTPLNHIQGFTTLLIAGVGGALSEKQSEYLGDIDNAARHLFELVTDILDHADQSREPDVDDVAPVVVGALVAAAQAHVQGVAEERGVRFSVEGSALETELRADRPDLERALMHVLRNAVQFSPGGGVVTVTARPALYGDGVEIAITDTGPGMSAEQVERFSGSFAHVEAAYTRTHGGLGFGLGLARSSVERHGGQLRIDSQPGAGTTVTFALPPAPPAAAPVPADKVSAAA